MEEEKKKGGWGGKRAGAGRKKGVKLGKLGQRKENPKSELVYIRVSADTLRKVKQLRELTKHDSVPFNDMFIAWVTEMAKDYGLEE